MRFWFGFMGLGLGGVLTLCFSPFGFFWLAPLLFAGVYRLRTGYWFGLGFFLCSVSWIYVSLSDFGQTPPILAGVLTAGFCAGLALFPYLAVRFGQGCFGFACAWVLSEWLRSTVLTGFPWVLVGYSQIHGPLSHWAPVVGVYGLSFIVVLAGAAIATRAWWVLFGIICFTGAGYILPDWVEPVGKPKTVALVQGNIPQATKWEFEQIPRIIKTYEALSAPHWDKDLVLWPESAVPYVWPYSGELLQNIINKNLLLGIPTESNLNKYQNSLMLMGTAQQAYHKQYLVPFGEYIPFTQKLRKLGFLFDLPMSDFVAGGTQQELLAWQELKIAPFICYEIAYGPAVLRTVPEANIIVTLSNVAWFGKSLALPQHLEIAQMRSLQTGREQLFLSNSGLTALIDTQGRIVQSLPWYAEGVLIGSVQGYQGGTIWSLMGDWPLLFCFALYLVLNAQNGALGRVFVALRPSFARFGRR